MFQYSYSNFHKFVDEVFLKDVQNVRHEAYCAIVFTVYGIGFLGKRNKSKFQPIYG